MQSDQNIKEAVQSIQRELHRTKFKIVKNRNIVRNFRIVFMCFHIAVKENRSEEHWKD